MSQTVVLVLPNDVVHDVSKKTRYHQDLHVITLPAVLKVSRDLWEVNRDCLTYPVSRFHVHKQLGKRSVPEKPHPPHSTKLHKGDRPELSLCSAFGSTGTQ